MKKINAFRILAITIIIAIGIISCSKEDSPITNNSNSLTSRLSGTQVDSLQTIFKNIMKSREYIALESSTKAMATALNGLKNAPLSTRDVFVNWLSPQISKTKFGSLSEAVRLYDELFEASLAYDKKYHSFYNGLKKLEDFEVKIILTPGFQSSPAQQTNGTPCQENCMDRVEADLDALDAGYAVELPKITDHMKRAAAMIDYWQTVEWMIGNFNSCMGNC